MEEKTIYRDTFKRLLIGCLTLLFSISTFATVGHFELKQITQLGTTLPVLPSPAINTQALINNLLKAKTPIPNGTGNFTQINKIIFSKQPSTQNFVFIGAGNNKQIGLYRIQNGKITMIANQQTQIPKGAGFFKAFSNVIYDSKNNKIIFIGSGILNQSGIYLYDGKSITKSVDQQNVIPKQKDLFKTFYVLSYDDGLTVFIADGLHTPVGLYIYYNNSAYKLISSTDKINKKDVQSIKILPNAYQNGALTFLIYFKGDKIPQAFQARLTYSPYQE